jgi:transcriptional regulator with XRE-family HTH domain
MSKPQFGEFLKKEREALEWSLRQLAEAASLNPGYVSRLENSAVVPEEKNLLKLADALAKGVDSSPETREKYRLKLANAAGRRPTDPKEIVRIKETFAARLRLEGFPEKGIESALKSVSLMTMSRVADGLEELIVGHAGDLQLAESARRRGEEVVVVPMAEHEFRAGDRAEIRVKGVLKPEQQDQLRIIARLIKNIVG